MRVSTRVATALGGAAALALLASLVVWASPAAQRRADEADLEPGLLQVEPNLRGSVSLGNAVYVRLDPGGLVVTRLSTEIWRGVANGATVTAGLGRLRWRGGPGDTSGNASERDSGEALRAREIVDRSLGNLSITDRRLGDRRVVYAGRVFADSPNGPDSRPVTITVTRRAGDSRVLLDVDVPGADVVALHAYRRAGFTYRGLGVQRAGVPLADRRYPMTTGPPGGAPGGAAGAGPGTDPVLSRAPVPMVLASTSTGFAIDPAPYASVDLRHDGRLDAVVWGGRLQARVYDGTPAQIMSQHTNDVGRAPALPTWATSGAVVGVRGSTAYVRSAVQRLQRADAAIAAVLVRDGGDRTRYPDWPTLVDRLSASDVRVLTSVSPALALRPRPGGPGDEPALLATARAHGWLVEGSDGTPVRVPVADPDVGSVPGALVDLLDPAAVDWYTRVLADRMRHERISGWAVEGGDELPPATRTALGDAGLARQVWPSRWAALVRAACQRADRPDCLLLQSTAGEDTVGQAGAISTGREATDWTDAGLGGALTAELNGGVSGLTLLHSPVGGVAGTTDWWGRRRRRSDELLQRWTELATFGPVLRTEDGDRPAEQAQVWGTPARAAAFAQLTRIFAALADYRRASVRRAGEDGMPVVRPLWLDDPEMGQDAGREEFRFGRSMVVVPVLRPGQRSVRAELAPGQWIELLTGRVHRVRAIPSASGSRPTSALPDGRPAEVTVRPVAIDAPLGRPVVLLRVDDPDAAGLRTALRSAGLVR
jgi:sulfoquinovosidase